MRKAAKIFTAALFAAALGAVASSAGAEGSFEGKWKMSIEYSKKSSSGPLCRGYLMKEPMVIKGHKVTGLLRHDMRGAFYLNGTISPDGTIAKGTAEGTGTAVFEGKLQGTSGGGTWQETATTMCDGTWKATKM
ncbi:MAG: hypothetical protein O2967_13540 [Proteobacteria bacterium]|nr:hypothetical protein [Pseudomonadota bacterium]